MLHPLPVNVATAASLAAVLVMPVAVNDPLFLVAAAYAINVLSISVADKPVFDKAVIVGVPAPTGVYTPVTLAHLERSR